MGVTPSERGLGSVSVKGSVDVEVLLVLLWRGNIVVVAFEVVRGKSMADEVVGS